MNIKRLVDWVCFSQPVQGMTAQSTKGEHP